MDREKRALALAAALFLVLAMFAGFVETAIAATAEDLAWSAGNLDPGKVSKVNGPPYAISADTVVVQRIKIVDNNKDGRDVNIVKVIVKNTGPENSATIDDLAQIILLDQDGKILALTKADATGLSFPITFDSERSITGIATPGLPYLIPDGGNTIFQIAVVVAAHPTDGHILQIETNIGYKEGGSSGIVTLDSVRDGAAETIRDAGLEEVSDKNVDAGRIVASNSATVQAIDLTDDDATYWDVKVTGVKIENQGSATYRDISLIEVLDKDGHVLGSDIPDERFNFAHGGFRIGLSFPIGDDTSTTLQIRVTLAKDAREGRTIQLKTLIEQEEPAGFHYPDAVAIDGSPESIVGVTGNARITIGSGTLLVGEYAQGSLELYISVSGFPTPGLGGLQVGPRESLSWDPNIIDVTKIEGVDPYEARYDPQVNINHDVGKATFTLLLKPNRDPITSGKIIKLTIDGQRSVAAGNRSKITLSYDILRDINNVNVSAAVIPGEVKIGVLGDVDFDNKVTIKDAQMVARFLLGLQDLTAEQQRVADFNQDGALNSIDVRLIAEEAIKPAGAAASQGQEVDNSASTRPIIGLFSSAHGIERERNIPRAELLRGFTRLFNPHPPARVALDMRGNDLTLSVGPPLGIAATGIQGRLSFRPQAMQIKGVQGLNGWTVLASSIDNLRGRAVFLAIRPSEDRGRGALRFSIEQRGAVAQPARLTVEALIDADCRDIPYRVDYRESLPPIQPNFRVEAISVWPNPLVSRDTAIFSVRGSGIAGIQVQVFDLAGRLIFAEVASGGTLEFRMDSPDGVRLANGVYLYLVTVKGSHGELYRSRVGKLVVLR